jgi:hypothetical protein
MRQPAADPRRLNLGIRHRRLSGRLGLRSASALLAVALASGGCFRYVAVPLASIPPREEVRVLITNDAGARLVKDLGAYTTVLDGEVASHGDSVSVAVPILREYRGMVLEGAPQLLYLSRPEIIEVRRRQLSRSRTAFTTAAAVVGFVGLVRGIIAIADPNPGSDDPLPPPPAGGRVMRRQVPTLIRVRIP